MKTGLAQARDDGVTSSQAPRRAARRPRDRFARRRPGTARRPAARAGLDELPHVGPSARRVGPATRPRGAGPRRRLCRRTAAGPGRRRPAPTPLPRRGASRGSVSAARGPSEAPRSAGPRRRLRRRTAAAEPDADDHLGQLAIFSPCDTARAVAAARASAASPTNCGVSRRRPRAPRASRSASP